MAERHFYEQADFARDFLIPFCKKNIPEFSGSDSFRILNVGCAEGGDLSVFEAEQKEAYGIEICSNRVELGRRLNPNARLSVGDITQKESLPTEHFDLIILRDVIEHVQDQEAAFNNILELLKPNGYLFISFPLKYSPYAGHQQSCRPFLKYFIYITMWPPKAIRFFCKLSKVPQSADEIIYNKRHALSFYRLNKLIKNRFSYVVKDFYILRPGFKRRYGLPTLKMLNIPILREVSLGCEFLLRKV